MQSCFWMHWVRPWWLFKQMKWMKGMLGYSLLQNLNPPPPPPAPKEIYRNDETFALCESGDEMCAGATLAWRVGWKKIKERKSESWFTQRFALFDNGKQTRWAEITFVLETCFEPYSHSEELRKILNGLREFLFTSVGWGDFKMHAFSCQRRHRPNWTQSSRPQCAIGKLLDETQMSWSLNSTELPREYPCLEISRKAKLQSRSVQLKLTLNWSELHKLSIGKFPTCLCVQRKK